MTFNFDTIVERHGSGSSKWDVIYNDGQRTATDLTHPRHGDRRLLPLWVADMDFPSPPAVVEALVARAQHGIYGYTTPGDAFYDAVLNWQLRRNGWAVEREWLVITPGIVLALNMAVQAFTNPGDKILIQRPVYHPFSHVVDHNERTLVNNALQLDADGRYTMDFADLEQKLSDPQLKLALLCHPHNPVGRVWTREELRCFGEMCQAHNVLVVTDEIHGDLIIPGHDFIPYAALGEGFAQNSIVCVAPSKTFNLAGLKTSTIIIPNAALRATYEAALERNAVYGANVFGVTALEAAFTHGDGWLDAVMAYIADNYHFMVDYLARRLPQVRVTPLEGTYLVWLDCRALNLDEAERKTRLMDDARLYFNEGTTFGEEGAGFERINIACPRAILAEALARLSDVLGSP